MTESVSGVNNVNTLANLNSYWKEKRFYYDGSGNLQYICKHHEHKAATSRSDWAVWKLTWSGNDIATMEGPIMGICDNRASLAWG